ncbi:Hpt domain-containing protein [Methylobacterium sp. J-090]|uniref:Hpt domain-containing protein n=1 Tax=Methylobacterium sp. J-090 TaxID=2836666 RepID=UPI001FB9783E|nr:Hpt domain-containing protein [Methylobacterium sp. J-090]MCJ2083257.1 Hpt domain-containing protein [Methylobacterium sp. J-090]
MPISAHPFPDTTILDGPSGASVASHPAGAVPVYDPATLAELEGVFGHARLMDLLAHLKIEISQRLGWPDTDRLALRHDAHTLLSVSGSLGFFDLSRRCLEMEQACLLGADLVAPLSAARAAAEGAIAAICDMEACAP